MKKSLIGVLCALMTGVFILLPGCSSGGSNSGAGSSSQASSAAGGKSVSELLSGINSLENMSFDYTLTTSAGTSTASAWMVKDKYYKIKTSVNGVDSVTIMNYTDNTMITYTPNTKTGFKMALSASSTSSGAGYSPEDFLGSADTSGAVDLGTETVNGENCRLVQYTYGSETVKMWVSTRLNFPVRIQATTSTSSASGGDTLQIDYSNISFNAPPSDTFTVPSDITITDMSNYSALLSSST